jgi:hypothetical protein
MTQKLKAPFSIGKIRYRCPDPKIHVSIKANNFADQVMANTHFFEPLFLLGIVPT